MFYFKKNGQVFDPKEQIKNEWMFEFAQSPSALVLKDKVRVYFCTRPKPKDNGGYLSYLAYVDLNRNNLVEVINICDEPLLPLGGHGAFDEFGTNPVSVISSGKEIRVYYAGWTRCESVPFNGAIGVSISYDGGETFNRIGDGPVLSYSHDEPFLLGSPRVRKYGDKWYLWYVAGKKWIKHNEKPEPIYKIRMATSDDGISWKKIGKDLISDVIGENECQACPDVIYNNGIYHMFFCYRNYYNYKGSDGGYKIGYASSKNMIDWVRNDDMVSIELSPSGWDSEMINYPHVFELDGNVYMLYQGNGMGKTGFGLAKMEINSDWKLS